MNQKTHTWIAIRAIALLEDEAHEENLVKLLKPHAREASVGAWIPDQIDAKRGGAGSSTDNHILKMKPYTGSQPARFTTSKEKLLKNIGIHRKIHDFLDTKYSLDPEWWDKPYKADPRKPGQHLPNRSMALSTMMKDLLLMGCPTIDALIPGDICFAQLIPENARTQEEAAVMYFFMLSHFIADTSMPCHCDARKLAGYKAGLHKEIEKHWSDKIDDNFEKAELLEADIDPKEVLSMARDVDTEFKLDFKDISIPDLLPDHDVWLEFIYYCRASFAVACVIAPPATYPFKDSNIRAPFDEVFGTNAQLLEDVDKSAMYDAVLNTAIVWKHVWNKVSKE